MKRQLALMALAATVLSINFQPANSAQKSSSSGLRRKARHAGLGSVERFKTEFQQDQGKVRLVALVSPT